jgi:LacI family transcriptional regulator
MPAFPDRAGYVAHGTTVIEENSTVKRATIQDVAAAADVSTATVSRVLNGTTAVSPETETRVRAAVAALDYTPNALTRGVFAGRSNTIGAIIRDIRSPFYFDLIQGLHDAAAGAGTLITSATTFREPNLEIAQINAMEEHRVRGLVITTGREADRNIRGVAARGTPCVIVTRSVQNPGGHLHTIRLDNIAAGRLAAEHLLRQGKTSLAVITGGKQQSQTQRLRGLRHALDDASVDLPADRVVACESNEDVPAAVGRLIRTPAADPRPTALACLSGRLSADVYTSLCRQGLAVPDDIAFITFDDFAWAEALRLTVITQPAYQMGSLAADLILRDPKTPSQTVFKPTLLSRQSCGE